MGGFQKLIDAILFVFFMFMGIGAPIIDSQTILPRDLFPQVLVNIKQWYTSEFEYYLHVEKPSFYVGIVWLAVLFVWPLSLFNLYGLVCNKSWFPTTCFICGVSVFTALVTILFEMIGSGKAPNKLIILYFHLVGLSILATLRGLLTKTVSNIHRPILTDKKMA